MPGLLATEELRWRPFWSFNDFPNKMFFLNYWIWKIEFWLVKGHSIAFPESINGGRAPITKHTTCPCTKATPTHLSPSPLPPPQCLALPRKRFAATPPVRDPSASPGPPLRGTGRTGPLRTTRSSGSRSRTTRTQQGAEPPATNRRQEAERRVTNQSLTEKRATNRVRRKLRWRRTRGRTWLVAWRSGPSTACGLPRGRKWATGPRPPRYCWGRTKTVCSAPSLLTPILHLSLSLVFLWDYTPFLLPTCMFEFLRWFLSRLS